MEGKSIVNIKSRSLSVLKITEGMPKKKLGMVREEKSTFTARADNEGDFYACVSVQSKSRFH